MGDHGTTDRAYQQAGLAPEFIVSGQSSANVDGADTGPLSSDARAHIQQQVDAIAGRFVADPATGRRTTPAAVLERFGGGRMLLARDAVRVGMADELATPEDVMRALAGKRGATAAAWPTGPLSVEQRLALVDLAELQRADLEGGEPSKIVRLAAAGAAVVAARVAEADRLTRRRRLHPSSLRAASPIQSSRKRKDTSGGLGHAGRVTSWPIRGSPGLKRSTSCHQAGGALRDAT